MEEIWKNIKGFESKYMISSYGRVKSIERFFVIQRSGGKKHLPEKILSSQLHYKGYDTIKLSKNNKSKRYKVHRLVAESFIQNPENKPCVNHINGIKNDNRVENLEWCTYSENTIHALDNSLKNTIFTREDILKIRMDNRTLSIIAKDYNCSFQTISEIKLKKTWSRI